MKIRNIEVTKSPEKGVVYVDYEYQARNHRWVKDWKVMTEEEAREFIEENT